MIEYVIRWLSSGLLLLELKVQYGVTLHFSASVLVWFYVRLQCISCNVTVHHYLGERQVEGHLSITCDAHTL